MVPSDRGSSEILGDGGLMLQLGVLLALMSVAFLSGWRLTVDRGVAVPAGVGRPRRRPAHAPTSRTAEQWTCEIGFRDGGRTSRFQAVVAPRDGGPRRVLAESASVPWPPADARKPPTRELELALDALVASLVDAGWEPIPSGDSWTRRRFAWRREGAPPMTVEPSLRRSEDRAARG